MIVDPDTVAKLDTWWDAVGGKFPILVGGGKRVTALLGTANDSQVRDRPIRHVDESARDLDAFHDLDRGQVECGRA